MIKDAPSIQDKSKGPTCSPESPWGYGRWNKRRLGQVDSSPRSRRSDTGPKKAVPMRPVSVPLRIFGGRDTHGSKGTFAELVLRYALAIGAVSVALAVRLAFERDLGPVPGFPFFLFALVVSAGLAGFGPMLVSIAASVLAFESVLLPMHPLSWGAHSVELHGFGCLTIDGAGPEIDFDFADARIVGFDAWRLWKYAWQAPSLWPEFEEVDAVGNAFASAVASGLLTTTPPNWAGSGNREMLRLSFPRGTTLSHDT